MEVRITIKGIADKDALRAYAGRKLAVALGRLEDRIKRVVVLLEDVTGPRKGGVSQRCRLHVQLRPQSEIVVDELGDSVHAVLAVALDRLKAALSRRLGKTKRGVGAG